MVTDLETLLQGWAHTWFLRAAMPPVASPIPKYPCCSLCPAANLQPLPASAQQTHSTRDEGAGNRGWGSSQTTDTCLLQRQGLAAALSLLLQSPHCYDVTIWTSYVPRDSAKGSQAKGHGQGACPRLSTLSAHCLYNFLPKETPPARGPAGDLTSPSAQISPPA